MTETVNRASDQQARGEGLHIERVFSTRDVHPYDEVTWERRDVVQTNWKTGATVFEQRDVEYPTTWSLNASTIVTTKYFRGAVGTEAREISLRQLIDRVVLTYVKAGKDHGYFASAGDAEVFEHELTWLLLNQYFSFNSPVWFNVGTQSPQQVSACFILSVDDSMDSILNWYKEEGFIFKGGSGAGLNLSRIRSSKELLSSGGTASGPVSFMRGADASAGTIKSGGATRRAGKMVVLDVDHPDIVEFVETKAREEDKIRALRDAGFDMDLGGKDIVSVQYQNANNSVRVTDEFMRAVEHGTDFGLKARESGEVIETVDAKRLWRKIATAAWECADPGLQYDDTINDWHTCPETGRITASNPCFPADQRVVTDEGLIRIGDLVERAAGGDTFAVYTNDVTSETDPTARVEATIPTQYMVTGTKEILELRFSDGSRLRCTPNHRVWTQTGWVRAEDLVDTDSVVKSVIHAERMSASPALPVAAQHIARRAIKLNLPEKWSDELAHYVGWLVGDGCVTGTTATAVYGSGADIEHVLPRHAALLAELTAFDAKPSIQANQTVQLRSSKKAVVDFLGALGVSNKHAKDKVVPEAVFTAPEEALVSFLQGLFDADGTVVDSSNGSRYVGLGSRSEELLLGVQELLASLGIFARIYGQPTKTETFSYTRKDGSKTAYSSDGPSFDLRITGRSLREYAALISFSLPAKLERLARIVDLTSSYKTDETVRLVSRESRGFETTYNLTEPRNHSYIVSGVVVANCSEYMHLDNSSCNLASLNLMKFYSPAEGTFDAKTFAKVTDLVFTAMDISICFADFPTQAIGETTRAYRQLGIGYANLGALLMANGLAYDSDQGRTMAGAITSLMQATAYKRSAELAGVVGAYDGYARNATPHKRVIRKHAAANDAVRPLGADDARILHEATKSWQECIKLGETNGYRNSQASVIAPTGCLTGDTLVTTDRGLSRLDQLGDVYGEKWQDVEFDVSTDEGPRRATKFFVNGEEETRRIVTAGGYTIQGTLAHRVKVVDPTTGAWDWKRLAEVAPGDMVPIQMDTLVGGSRQVPLPVLDQAYYAGDRNVAVPQHVDADLAELVGYFMGDGSLHAKGIRLCVADTDLDVIERLRVLSKGLFNLEPKVEPQEGHHEVTLTSVRLARWWQAAGFAKTLPADDHVGKGWVPRVPAAILESNDKNVYAAFLRGLFEADGTVGEGVPNVATAKRSFAAEVQSLLLTLGLPSTVRETASGFGITCFQVRLRNNELAVVFGDVVGFLGDRKARQLATVESVTQTGNRDRIVLPRVVWDELVPAAHEVRAAVTQSLRKTGGVARSVAEAIYRETRDERLKLALDYVFETVAANEDGGVQPTFDLSVPDNVTYVANGFVSHNTIGLMMDCDTTGLEPDLALVKMKKLVGGASMKIVNQTVPMALRKLGYTDETVEAIVEYIAEHGHVIDAPGLRTEHYSVFDCAMGERSISWQGHIRMMGAIQPQISGALSKTVNLPDTATVEDIEDAYMMGWKLGLKAVAVYRNMCKVGQPLSDMNDTKKAAAAAVAAGQPHEHRPIRKRLPKKRPSQTVSFSVGGAEGYMTAGSYPDDGLGEVFLKLGKQGSTLAGVMDAFSIAISIALQYGVPLETYVSKFTNMRFDPAGMTDDPDVRMAQSVMDYVFRRLALDYLPYDKRAELGIFTAEERAAAVSSGSYGAAPVVDTDDLESLAQSVPVVDPVTAPAGDGGGIDVSMQTAQDAPLCLNCGIKMRPAGSCYVCESCGSTSGCS